VKEIVMQFTDIEARWAELDRKLDGVAVDVQARIGTMAAARSTTRLLARQVAAGVFVNAAIAVLLGLFCARHVDELRFLVPALAIDVGAIALLIRGIRQLILLANTDLSASVVTVQRSLEELRLARIQTNKWTLILAPLLWTPLLIVALQALFGVDSYATFPPVWFVANTLLGLAFIVLMVWVSMRFGDRFHDAAYIAQSLHALAGRTRLRTTAFLEQLRAFERDR
jgi:hypothetical protein